MKHLPKLSAIVVFAAVLAACAPAPNTPATPADAPAPQEAATDYVRVDHRSGTTYVAPNPQNVAVFDLATLDSMDTLGLSGNIAGLPYGTIPYHISHLFEMGIPDFGTMHVPNLEMMAQHDIDLIIITGRARPMFEDLSSLAPTIDLGLDVNNMYESFVENNRAIGRIFGMEAEMEAHLAELDLLFDEVNALSAQLGTREALIILYNEGTLNAFGPSGRFGIIHDYFGVPYVDAGIEIINHGMLVSNEYIVEQNPDIIFVIDRNYQVTGGAVSNQVDFENELVQLTTAYQEGNIFYLNPEAWYISPGGLVSMRIQLEDIITALQQVLS